MRHLRFFNLIALVALFATLTLTSCQEEAMTNLEQQIEAKTDVQAFMNEKRPKGQVAAKYGPCTNDLPKKLCIFYGYPSEASKTSAGSPSNVTRATSLFSEYDLVVFARDLQKTSHADHQKTSSIISALPASTQVFGYIPLARRLNNTKDAHLTIDQVRDTITAWKNMGVEGIFLDEAGTGFNVDRTFLNQALDAVHNEGLNAFVNAWRPEEVFDDRGPVKMTASDYYLLESFQIMNNAYVSFPTTTARDRYMNAYNYKQQYGTQIATTTTNVTGVFSTSQLNYAWWSTLAYGFDAMSWAEKNFAAGTNDNYQPFRIRPSVPMLSLAGAPLVGTSSLTTQTSRGDIIINTSAHTAQFTTPRKIRHISTNQHFTESASGRVSLTPAGHDLELVDGLIDPCLVSIRIKGTSRYLIPYIAPGGTLAAKFEDQNTPVTAGSSFNDLASWYIEESKNVPGTFNIYYDNYGYPYYIVKDSSSNDLFLMQWHNGSPGAEGSFDLMN